ncbi:hypothetical protein E6H37_04785 [Candidatus Bathyarchaeota archaeon]|nr:MAG: hypothetical protein E6H37_04785 [Candidatus Bathyarchaeota archaeon]
MRHLSSRVKALPLIALSLLFLVPAVAFQAANASTVSNGDFQAQSFSKVVDWYDYVRQYAANNNLPQPNATEHAYIYTNYINVGGFQLFYAGLVNATHNGTFVTIPIQTFFEHFKTVGGKDAITASSFISLVSFNESNADPYPNSPDRTDTVYASFSLAVNLTAITGHKLPGYVASSQVTPLTQVDSQHYTWGLKYTNLNAIWWKINPDPFVPTADLATPRGFAQYSELSFNYALAIDPTSKTATLTTSYTIGRMTDLYVLSPTPAVHFNATGSYNLSGSQINTQNIYQFLQSKQLKISIVLANKAILAGTITDKDDSGASVDNSNSTDVTHTAVNTDATDGDKVFKADFGVKSKYQLYNYTADSSENTASPYNVNVRTVNVNAWAGNPVFWFQNRFMGFLPLFVANVDPGLIKEAKAGLVNLTFSDYLYIISYPTWGGYKIVHDPDYTAFYTPSSNVGLLTAIFLAVAVAAGVGGLFAFLFRKRRVAGIAVSGAGPTGPRPTQDATPSGPTIPGR